MCARCVRSERRLDARTAVQRALSSSAAAAAAHDILFFCCSSELLGLCGRRRRTDEQTTVGQSRPAAREKQLILKQLRQSPFGLLETWTEHVSFSLGIRRADRARTERPQSRPIGLGSKAGKALLQWLSSDFVRRFLSSSGQLIDDVLYRLWTEFLL